PRPQISHVVFHSEGTFSWLRHGWPEIMAQLFREHVPPLPGESESDIHELLLNEILALNGRPSIFQMQRCAQLVRERGGNPPAAEQLLAEYQHRLEERIRERTELILSGATRRDDFVVHGARALFETLPHR